MAGGNRTTSPTGANPAAGDVRLRVVSSRTTPILLLTFVNALGGTLLIPVLPFVVRDLGQSDFVFALLIAAYPFAQFFAAPVLGNMADHFGRRPVLLVSQAGTLASWVVFGLAYAVDGGLALGLIAVSRLIDGLTGGNQSVAAAYLADVTTDAERSKIFSQQGAIAGVALIIGPALGSFSATGPIGFLGPALIAIVISAITLAACWLRLDESLPADQRADALDLNPLHQLNLLGAARRLDGSGPLLRLFSIQALLTLGFSGYGTIIILWYADRLGVSEANAGLLMLATGVFLIVNELLVVPRVTAALGDVGAMVFGLSVAAVGFAVIGIPTTVIGFLPLAYLMNIGLATSLPTLQALVTRAADEREKGAVQGINTSVAALASTAAPIIAGALYTSVGGGTTLRIVAATVATAAVVFALSARTIGDRIGVGVPVVHRHGPVHAVARCQGNGHRNVGLHVHGPADDTHAAAT